MFVYERDDETTATNVCIWIGLMKLQLQMFIREGVNEATAAKVCI